MGQYCERSDDETLVYQPRPKIKKEEDVNPGNEIIRPNDESNLPKTGFFAIECLGKNKIIVGRKRVEQNQVALLENGTTIKLASYSLYFLLPSDCSSENKVTIMKVPNPAYEEYQKRAMERTVISGDVDDESSSTPLAKKSRTSAPQGIGAELEALPTETLLARISEARKMEQWDRKNQMLGTAVAMHAVRDAARSPELRSIAKEHGGVARGDVLEWIENSPVYSKWVQQMLTVLEEKSYQSNISKAVLRAGYIKSGTSGRHIRWALPQEILSSTGQIEKGERKISKEEECLDGMKVKTDSKIIGISKNVKSNENKKGGTKKEVHSDSENEDVNIKIQPKRKRRPKKDPNAPKRVKGAFMFFSSGKFQQLHFSNYVHCFNVAVNVVEPPFATILYYLFWLNILSFSLYSSYAFSCQPCDLQSKSETLRPHFVIW